MRINNKIDCIDIIIPFEFLLVDPAIAIEATIKNLQKENDCNLYIKDYEYNPATMEFYLRLVKERCWALDKIDKIKFF